MLLNQLVLFMFFRNRGNQLFQSFIITLLRSTLTQDRRKYIDFLVGDQLCNLLDGFAAPTIGTNDGSKL